ncbi:MAG: cell division protein FtsK, partial [Lactobacillus crispatus]|nr:cell division protein FtsK [Lactobacillus crispatus]
MNPALLHAIFYWILPLSISLSAFFIFLNIMHRSYEKTDVDRVWKVSIRIGIALGIIALIYVLFITVPVLKMLTHYIDLGLTKLGNTQVMQATKNEVLKQVHAAILFFKNWIPVYLRAVVLVWVPAISIWILGLYWRIKFTRALNIVVRTIFLFPYLTAKYFFGYQTPFFDYVQAKLYVAKIKENLNDSYFDALQGIDETGKKFDNGQGGTVKTQSIKAATLAIRQTKSHIKTANGVRHAQLVVRHSRETSTD